MNLSLNPRRVVLVLALVAGGLVLANATGLFFSFALGHNHVHGLVPLFDMSRERNVPTWFSSVLLLMGSALLAVVGRGTKQAGNRDHRWWIALALIFLFLAVDESLSFHEKLNRPFATEHEAEGVFHYAWVIPYGVLVLVLGLLSLRFLLRLPSATRLRLVVAAALYVGGAVGMEMLAGVIAVHSGSEESLAGHVATAFEESLEMSGVIVMIYALLTHIESHLPGLNISVRS